MKKKLLVWGFCGFLGIMMAAGMILPQTGFSETENRYLQKRPEFSWKTFLKGTYGTEYEAYLSDQFPGRNSWVGLKVLAERAQLSFDVNDVYFGKDGYLIQKFDREDIETEQLAQNLERLTFFLQDTERKLGKDHVRVMLVPSSSQILKNKLPLGAAPYDQNQVTEQLIAQMGEVMVVPVEEKLKEVWANSEEGLYYETDHHWTALGAYVGYKAWAGSLGEEPVASDAFDIHTVSKDFYGTILSKINVGHQPDSIQLYIPKDAAEYQVFFDGSTEGRDSLYSMNALEKRDQYAVYLDGNHALTHIVNEDIDEGLRFGEKLLIIKDSYAHSFAPFAVNHYDETFMIDLRYFNQDLEIFMEEQGITDVLVLYQIPGFAKEKTVSKIWRQ